MLAVLALAAWSALCILAGYLTHRARTRTTVNRLDAQLDQLLADLAAISPDAAEYRQAVLVDHERRKHATIARLNAFHLGSAA